jgi:hypothetical protein
MRKILTPLALTALFVLVASCRNIRAEANMAEAMSQLETQLLSMQQDYSILQFELDSLRGVVARQDTLLTRLAQMANLPVPQH